MDSGWTSTASEKWCKQMKQRRDFSERLKIQVRSIFPGMGTLKDLKHNFLKFRNSIIWNTLIIES